MSYVDTSRGCTQSRIYKNGQVVALVYVILGMVVVKSVKTGKLQEFASVQELKVKLEPMGCKLVISYSQMAELQKLTR